MTKQDINKIENQGITYLPIKSNVIIKLNAESFKKKITIRKKVINNEYDQLIHSVLFDTAKIVGKSIMNLKYIYSQSDKIYFLIDNTDKKTSQYGGNIMKTASSIASRFTLEFNKNLRLFIKNYHIDKSFEINKEDFETEEEYETARDNILNDLEVRLSALKEFVENGLSFDANVFYIAEEDIADYFEFKQNAQITTSLIICARKYLEPGDDKLPEKDIIHKLSKSGHRWSNEEMSFRFGLGYIFDKNTSSWKDQTLMGIKAKKIIKDEIKIFLRENTEKDNKQDIEF